MELLQRTAKRPSKLSKPTPARLVTIMTTPSMSSYGRGMHNCLAAKEWKAIIKYGQNDFTRKNNRLSTPKAWISSANVLPLQEPWGKLLKTLARQQRLETQGEFYVGSCSEFGARFSPATSIKSLAYYSKLFELCNPSNPN